MKNTANKITLRLITGLFLLAIGFAAGFPAGERTGFATGTEWAMVQADLLAREAGMTMPVFLEDNAFKVVLKQPKHLYRTARKLANSHELVTNTSRESLPETGETAPDDDSVHQPSSDVVMALAPGAATAAAVDQQPRAEEPAVRSF
ncbi:MAG TPA: hypothetical protein VK654_13495 [Nitrospirota bacterium]|nr:hypothetical protein [Nitrospirota bacterium]